jgi:hypothetical protein
LLVGIDPSVVRLFDRRTGKLIRSFEVQESSPLVAALFPDGKRLAICTKTTLSLRDVATGKEISRIDTRGMEIAVLRFSPRGNGFVTTGWDRQVRFWDMNGSLQSSFPGIQSNSANFALSPDGRIVAIPGQKNAVVLWDVQTGKQLRQLGDEKSSGLFSLAFSPDGNRLAGGANSRTFVWDVATGAELYVLGDREGGVFDLAFSADGRTLAAGCWDAKVRLWELSTGQLRGRWEGHTDRIFRIAFAPDSRAVASAGVNATALLWDTTGLAGEGPPALGVSERDTLWRVLAGASAETAYRAAWRLVAAGDGAVTFLKERIRPVSEDFKHDVDRHLMNLTNDREDVRGTVFAELDRLGPLALSALQKALDGHPKDETRDRIEYLLRKLERGIPSGEHLRLLRTIEILELIGTPAARKLLAELARGLPEAVLTRDARQSLHRLNQRASSMP